MLKKFTIGINKILRNYECFGCIYGSYPSNTFTEISDIDFFVATEKRDEGLYNQLRGFTISFHENNGLPLDQEVPYENKILVTYDELDKAVKLDFFIVENTYRVHSIQKNKKYLTGLEIKLRMLFNSLTTPHIFIGNNKEKYLEIFNKAKIQLLNLSIALSGKDIFSVDDLVKALIIGNKNQQGEEYLGYKWRKAVILNLYSILEEQLKSFVVAGKILRDDKKNRFKVNS